MKLRLPHRQRATETSHARDTTNTPEPTGVTWTRAQLRDRIQQTGAALVPPTPRVDRHTHQTDRSPLADREAEP